MKEFWNEMLTDESWKKLVELSKEFDFTVIGGWAAYLWTKTHKSKDIDFVTDYQQLIKLRKKFDVQKNDFLKKYEIKFDKFDADIYLPSYSPLVIPPQDILSDYCTKVDGIKTVTPEALLVLKQAAEIDRRASVKGKKDAIDIITLLIHADVSLKKYKQILEKYGLRKFAGELLFVVKNFDDQDIEFIGLDFKQFRDWRKKTIVELKKL